MEETSHIQQTTQDSLHSLIMRFNKRSKTSSYQKKLHLLCNNNIIVPVKFTSGRKNCMAKRKRCKKIHARAIAEGENERLRGNVSTEEVCWFGFYKWFLIRRLPPVLWRLQNAKRNKVTSSDGK